MMLLFGGFGEECLAAYDAEHPLAPGWQERVPWYQLPPLLVHAVRFGGGYGDAAVRALRQLREFLFRREVGGDQALAVGELPEVASPVVFLASDAARAIHGAAIPVMGRV